MALKNNKPTGGWGGATAIPQDATAGGSPKARPQPPTVQLVGDVSHPDFRDAVALLRADAQLITTANMSPELIVIAQSRPGSIDSREVEKLKRSVPLAGMVALAGSWCEGETRTGRPWPGVERLYWYEFPPWWRRQMALRAAGCCPDWARPGDSRFQNAISNSFKSEPGGPPPRSGLIILRVPHRPTANALTDVLHRSGYAIAWQPHGRPTASIRGAIAGIWDGGQLNDREAEDLSAFCRYLANYGAPVVAMLDFPRRDRVDRALEIGAATVLGKPWLNADLIATLQAITERPKLARVA